MKTLSLFVAAVLCSLFAVAISFTAQGLTFTTSTYSVGSEPLVAVGSVNDVNGDGRLDILTGNWKSNNITVLTNNGLGNFGYYATISAGTNPEVNLADVNGDGKPYMITHARPVISLTTIAGCHHWLLRA